MLTFHNTNAGCRCDRRKLFTAGIIVVWFGLANVLIDATRADEPVSETPSEDVQSLVEQLTADSRRVRLAAEAQLLNLGPEILPSLPRADDIRDANTRTAIARIRKTLETRQVDAQFQSSTFTLRGEHQLQHVAAELSRQTGNTIGLSRLPATLRSEKVSVRFENVPFWQAVTIIAEQKQLAWQINEGQMTLIQNEKPSTATSALPTAVVGPFHIALENPSVKDLPGASGGQLWSGVLVFTSEPRLQPLVIRYQSPSMTAASGDEKHKTSWQPFVTNAKYDRTLTTGNRQARVPVQFHVPENASGLSRSLTLQGNIDILCATPNRVFHFSVNATQPIDTAKQQADDVSIIINERTAGNLKTFVVNTAYRRSPLLFESHYSTVLPGDVRLQTPDGKIQPTRDSIEGKGAIHEQSAGFSSNETASATALLIERPTAIRTVSIKFTLTGIPIPSTESEPDTLPLNR